jgi:hypothetical protein
MTAAALTPARTAARVSALGLGVAGLALAGVLARLWLAVYTYPTTGDPVFSYCYRALLLAHGHAEGLFLMWHPPGYPLLLAALVRLFGGLASPYALGVGVSLLSSAALVWIVDRLAAERLRWPVSRLALASFLVLHEGLVWVSAAPLTEPVYLVLLYGAILLATADSIPASRALAIGLLLGIAGMIRTEALAPIAGLTLYLGARSLKSRRWSFLLVPAAALALCGWVLAPMLFPADLSPLSYYRNGYTIPPAAGLAANLRRAVECAYWAFTEWLPQTILLPYFALAAVGLAATWNHPRMDRLNRTLLAALLPQAVLVVLTTMHKRTGVFLIPAVALWCVCGLELLVRRVRGLTPTRRAVLFTAAAILLNALQLGRLAFFFAKRGTTHDPATLQQARVLREAAASPGKVWAFGGEPEVYAFWDQPVVYPFPQRAAVYNPLYGAHAGRPGEFIAALRGAGFSYLTFSLGPQGDAPAREPQVYGDFSGQPLREDLRRIVAASARYGLEPLGSLPADRGSTRVYAFRLGKAAPP